MAKKVSPIPKGYHGVTAYLCVNGAAAAITFYKKVLGAKEAMRIAAPGGRVAHAELEIGGSKIMLADESPQTGFKGPRSHGGSPVMLHLYVEKVDRVFARAVKAGATERQPPKDQFYGDRNASFEDPFGHVWYVATHIEDVSPKEMKRRAKEAMSGEPPA